MNKKNPFKSMYVDKAGKGLHGIAGKSKCPYCGKSLGSNSMCPHCSVY